MRTTAPRMLPLFRSELAVRVLAAILLDPPATWSAERLAEALDAPASSVHRELHRALDAGIVGRDEALRPHRYAAAKSHPLHDPLRELLARSVGLERELADAIEAEDGVDAAVIHGSWVAGRLSADSDVDVLVVGDADLNALRRRTREVGRRAGRRIDVTLFRVSEFREGLAAHNPFLSKIVDGPVTPLVGDLAAVS